MSKAIKATEMLSPSKRYRCLLFVLCIGISLFIWDLGSTGLIDETPPLFAAAGRAMSVTGDWLTPRVNGLPRFDKPPLVYWLMGIGYSLPNAETWDPFGTWAGRLPSAISTLLMMLYLADTLLCYPQKNCLHPRRTAVVAALAFALSPLVIVWSRIAVSDALLCATFGISMLLQWRRYANPGNQRWQWAWVVLGLAVLTKGPVSLVLMGMTLFFFGLQQRQLRQLCYKLKPIKGLLITSLIAFPWYAIEYLIEGQPFWDSFFGYHNFQRFTSVVNSHSEPWWFFCLILVVASLPFTPYLLFGLFRTFGFVNKSSHKLINGTKYSLTSFAFCWLISVFLLFTFAATKLPSYWLPATPAAAILISLSDNYISNKKTNLSFYPFLGSIIILVTLSLLFWTSRSWIANIYDPEMPFLGSEIAQSGLLEKASICLLITSILGVLFSFKNNTLSLLPIQFPLVAFYLLLITPIWRLGDKLRQLPLRQASELIVSSQQKNEPFAMVGAIKPSVHFYTNQIILYEGRSSGGLVNLSERLSEETRDRWQGRPILGLRGSRTTLVIIDQFTSSRPYWQGLNHKELGQFGIYKVWRVDRVKLINRAKKIVNSGIAPDWKTPRPERF